VHINWRWFFFIFSFLHFRRHVKKLKDEYLGEKVQRYFDLLPEVMREMFPDFDTMGEG
jgi:hypothetical protein